MNLENKYYLIKNYEFIFDNSLLITEQSKKTYKQSFKKFLSIFDNNIPDDFYFIKEKLNNYCLNTRISIIASLLSLIKHSNIVKLEKNNPLLLYIEDLNKEKYNLLNKPNEKQLKCNITYKDLLLKFNELLNYNDFNNCLLLGLYCLIPPVRANYGDVILCNNEEEYIYLNNNNMNNIFNNKISLFNLKVKKYNHSFELPDNLLYIINKCKEITPRKYLFISKFNQNEFSQYANSILKKIFNNNYINITFLRHIYINNLDFNNLTIKEKDEIAKKMNHSRDMQDKYRLVY